MDPEELEQTSQSGPNPTNTFVRIMTLINLSQGRTVS